MHVCELLYNLRVYVYLLFASYTHQSNLLLLTIDHYFDVSQIIPVCINICVFLFVWAASLMSVCFSGSLLSASIHCIHCNISVAQKINFD